MATNPVPAEETRTSPRLLLDAKVARVTLLEDRAQVTREGKVKLAKGSHRLTIANVSPVIADRSVVARAGSGVRVDEAKVVRRWRIGADERPGDAAKLAEEGAKLLSELERKQEIESHLEQQRAMIEQAADFMVESINRELPYAKAFPSQWPLDLESFLDAVRGMDATILDASKELRELRSKMEALRLRAIATGRVDHVLQCDLELDLTVTEDGEKTLSIGYMVPCALWRPVHRATLVIGAKPSVSFECEGAVWQATGEDWNDVDLSFSTARSTQRAEPPVMYDDRLRVQRKPDRKVDVEIRDQTIATTGETVERHSDDLPGVDDGGESRLLGASSKATIAADGRLYRVPIYRFDAGADVDRIARPERSALVHLRSKQANGSKQPILAGPVELLRDSGYVGRALVEYVAPGERFVLGWGAEDALRVKRQEEVKKDVTRLMGKQIVTHVVELFLSNLDDAPASFRVEERIPVSEVEQVSVQLDEKETNPLAKPDDQGILAWNVTLPAHGTQKVKLAYRVTASSDVKGL